MVKVKKMKEKWKEREETSSYENKKVDVVD